MRIGILGNAERDTTAETLRALVEQLRLAFPEETISMSADMAGLNAVQGIATSETLHELAAASDVIFSIGGDGTMLSAGRAIMRGNPQAQLIGVNVGKLGFLSENPPSELELLIHELAAGKLKAEPRLMLQASVESEKGSSTQAESMNALNEIVIDNYRSTRMLTLEVYVDKALLGVMRADGIIIATPTGSTGYAVSAGGPIVEPTSPVMLITPIAPHSLNIRPIIVPENCTVTVRASSDETKQALVVADGQEEVVVGTPAIIEIKAAPNRLQLLRRRERSYFDLLRHKLLWSMDQRDAGRY